ncbi:MAG: hypothetical protein IKH34_03965 [Oscillospiraceae bacterium]|nr:hypothetical protein [Oscillospiraceae bacterium]
MFQRIKQRLASLEQRIWSKFSFWPGNDDNFISALGVDPEGFKMINADGRAGFDFLAALSSTAAEDWAEENQ